MQHFTASSDLIKTQCPTYHNKSRLKFETFDRTVSVDKITIWLKKIESKHQRKIHFDNLISITSSDIWHLLTSTFNQKPNSKYIWFTKIYFVGYPFPTKKTRNFKYLFLIFSKIKYRLVTDIWISYKYRKIIRIIEDNGSDLARHTKNWRRWRPWEQRRIVRRFKQRW